MITPVHAFACTAVYVGSEVSADGTMIIAKSNDYQDVWANYVAITERVDNMPGRTMPVDNDAAVLAELPATTYRYISTPWMESTIAANGLGKDAAVCANEYGVVMIIAVTAASNKAALQADPLIEHGLTETTAADLVTGQSASAREAVDVLLSILDQYGSSEVNIAFIADRNEAWYIEMYTGHQYAAVKLPQDKVMAFGNEFLLEYVSDYEEYILSPDLESLAADNGFAVYGPSGELNLFDTYSGPEVTGDLSHMRTWIGHRILSPSVYGDYDLTAKYPLCFEPDSRVSLEDVMELIRNRYEGTEYSPDETGRTDMRVIGTDAAMSVHIAQVYPDVPANRSVVVWESTGPAIYGVFVPVSNAALSISEPYGRCQSAEEAGIFDTVNYPYYRFKDLSTLCVGKDALPIYGQPVRSFWQKAEQAMAQGMNSVIRNTSALSDEAAARYITDYCNMMQEQAFGDAGYLLNSVRWHMSKNSNTLKNSFDPETDKLTDKLKVIPPLVIDRDTAVYQTVPSLP